MPTFWAKDTEANEAEFAFPQHSAALPLTHYVRDAQSRGLGLKVSDEFTVPLCATHHHQIHTTGREREWWQQRNIDPLIIASALWQQSRDRHPNAGENEASEDQLSRARCSAASEAAARCQPHAATNKTMSETAAFFHAMAPTLIANVLTVVFVYCFAAIGQQERSGEGRPHISGSSSWFSCSCSTGVTAGAFTHSISRSGSRHPTTAARHTSRRCRKFVSPLVAKGTRLISANDSQLLRSSYPLQAWFRSWSSSNFNADSSAHCRKAQQSYWL